MDIARGVFERDNGEARLPIKTSTGPTPPARGLFSTGLMTAILGGTVPSVVDGALNPMQQTPGPMVDTTAQVTANNGGSSSAAVGTTQGIGAHGVPTQQNDKSSAPGVMSAAPTRRMVTRANTEITLSGSDTPSSVVPATKSPAKPKRPRGAAATAALAEAQLSSAALEEIDHIRDGLQGLATRVGDIQNRFEASMHDASVQLGDMQDSIDSLNALKTEHKVVRFGGCTCRARDRPGGLPGICSPSSGPAGGSL
ncbi:hypothetical protein FA13DRAFT_1710808 [Coprinellus micaceus]|uniref:Uncharacterized protein n=1 Tax=Coprinellus micaceus TaxID=71717 RepID=A0A4Y7T6Z5_COPMI|nr:hypothetical protein FA13DRAFT_1710808 [Coprinellus micaceus]